MQTHLAERCEVRKRYSRRTMWFTESREVIDLTVFTPLSLPDVQLILGRCSERKWGSPFDC